MGSSKCCIRALSKLFPIPSLFAISQWTCPLIGLVFLNLLITLVATTHGGSRFQNSLLCVERNTSSESQNEESNNTSGKEFGYRIVRKFQAGQVTTTMC